MITKRKTIKPSTKRKKPAKKLSYHDIYFCTVSWRQKPVHEDQIMDLGKDFYMYACNLAFNTKEPEPSSLQEWLARKGVLKETFMKWRKKYDALNQIVKEGMAILGIIREKGMLTKRFAEKSCMYTMHHYLDEWKDYDKYHDKRAKDLDGKTDGNFVVKMVDFSKSENA